MNVCNCTCMYDVCKCMYVHVCIYLTMSVFNTNIQTRVLGISEARICWYECCYKTNIGLGEAAVE